MAATLGELIKSIQDVVYENTGQEITGAALQGLLINMASLPQQQFTLQSNIGISGGSAEGAFVNGNATITGNADTEYADNTSFNGLSYVNEAYVFDGSSWFFLLNITIVDDQTITINEHYNVTSDPLRTTPLGGTWAGVTGTHTLYAYANAFSSLFYLEALLGFGNSINDNFANNVIIGGNNRSEGFSGDFFQIIGNSNQLTATNPRIISADNCTLAGDFPTVINSESCVISAGTVKCTIISSSEAQISEGQNVIAIGLSSTDDVNIAGLTDTTVVKALAYYDPVPEHADNAAALLAGLVIGQTYRTGDFLKVVH